MKIDGSTLVHHESETASDSTGCGAGRLGPHNPHHLRTGSGHLSGLRHLHEITRLEDCVELLCCSPTDAAVSQAGDALSGRVAGFVTTLFRSATLVSLPAYQIDRLQSVLNAAARLVYSSRRYDHVTPLLHELHWLRMSQRINYKLAVLVYRCLNGLAPRLACGTVCRPMSLRCHHCRHSRDG